MTWMQTLYGGAFDLLDPRPDMVNFREIAWALAHINRYCGHANKPVSVALHTMIVCLCGAEVDRPYLLLHDAAEAYTGDLISPMKVALGNFPMPVMKQMERLQERCDAAIFAAAALSAPTPETSARVKHADLRALKTERRDFLARAPKSWGRHIDAVEPYGDMKALKALYRAADKGPIYMADRLASEFEQCLPSLKRAA